MSLELLVPIENESLIGTSLFPKQVMGNNIELHTESKGLPKEIASNRQTKKESRPQTNW